MLRLIEGPSEPLVTLAEARAQCRVDAANTEDNAALERFIAAATHRLDGRDGLLGMCLRPQTWELVLAAFPSARRALVLPLYPVISVESVKYLDTAEAEQTLSAGNYRVVAGAGLEPTTIIPTLAAATWPIAAAVPDAVRVRFVAGHDYDSPADSPPAEVVPEPIRQAALLLVDHWFEQRAEATVGVAMMAIPQGVLDLIAPYRQFYSPEAE